MPRSHRPATPVPPNDVHNYFFGLAGCSMDYTMHNPPWSTIPSFAGSHNYTVSEVQEVIDYFNIHKIY